MATNPNGTPYRPLWFYVVYDIEGKLYGYLLNWKPAWEAQKDYSLTYKFEGREATYWIATDDNNILRKDALSFALAVHEDKVIRYRADLSEVAR